MQYGMEIALLFVKNVNNTRSFKGRRMRIKHIAYAFYHGYGEFGIKQIKEVYSTCGKSNCISFKHMKLGEFQGHNGMLQASKTTSKSAEDYGLPACSVPAIIWLRKNNVSIRSIAKSLEVTTHFVSKVSASRDSSDGKSDGVTYRRSGVQVPSPCTST